MSEAPEHTPAESKQQARGMLFQILVWLLAAGCFYLVVAKINGAAARDGVSLWVYLRNFFADVNWLAWLALMVPYSCFFFLVDTHATWRVVRWFNAPQLPFTKMLPIRASAYILSLVNEQVGKGAMTLYLWRRYQVPAWQALSSMLMLGLIEVVQLLMFSAVGTIVFYELVQAASSQLPLDKILPAVLLATLIYLPLHIAYFRGHLLPTSKLRDKAILRAFRLAEVKHYLLLIIFKAPNLLVAVVVYTLALRLFNVDVVFGQVLAFLPVIFLAAALPLPFHAGALLLWTVLFPDYPEVGVFSLIMHTFFVLFNATIGLVFLPAANRELFSPAADA